MDLFILIVFILIVLLVLFYNKVRDFYAWWNKTNEVIKALEKNNELLREILNRLPEKKEEE